jgi:hypothetical protein
MNSSIGERSWYVKTKLRRILPCTVYSSWSSSSTWEWDSLCALHCFFHVAGRQSIGCCSITQSALWLVIRLASSAHRSRL